MLPVKNADDIPFSLYERRKSLAANYCPIGEESGTGNLLIPSLMSGASIVIVTPVSRCTIFPENMAATHLSRHRDIFLIIISLLGISQIFDFFP
jgi:hypothetical protein